MTPGCTGRHNPQLALLERVTGEPHRVDDGPTARIAARSQTAPKLSRGRERVLEVLRTNGTLTDGAIAELTGMHPGSASKRRHDLVRLGLVEEAGRSVSPYGSPASTWRLTLEGLALAQRLASQGARHGT